MCPEYNFVPEGKKEPKKLEGLVKMTVESTQKFSQRPNLEQLEHENDKMNYNILILKESTSLHWENIPQIGRAHV